MNKMLPDSIVSEKIPQKIQVKMKKHVYDSFFGEISYNQKIKNAIVKIIVKTIPKVDK